MTWIWPESWGMADLLVVNASPLIFLGNAGRLELLRVLGASRIVVPQPVFDEVISGGKKKIIAIPEGVEPVKPDEAAPTEGSGDAK